jgi:hypothetical protein
VNIDSDPVRGHSSSTATGQLDRERLERIAEYGKAPSPVVTEHLRRLDREWDIERRLEANAATIALTAVLLTAVHSRRWLLLAGMVPAFLLQHAIQGWCPPIEVFRRLGARSRNEIDAERTAIKALRGDFDDLRTDGDPMAAAARALEVAGRR